MTGLSGDPAPLGAQRGSALGGASATLGLPAVRRDGARARVGRCAGRGAQREAMKRGFLGDDARYREGAAGSACALLPSQAEMAAPLGHRGHQRAHPRV